MNISKKDLEKHKKHWKELKETIEIYKKIGKRNLYLFDWLLFVWENSFLSCVEEEYKDSLTLTKTKIVIIDTLIDDVADSPNTEVDVFLEEYLKFPFFRENINWHRLTKKQIEYIKGTIEIWDDVIKTIKNYPRYNEFRKILEFDIQQILNSMRFSHLVNTFPKMDNIIENRTYGHHGMSLMVCRMLDLMCSPSFDINELNCVRAIFYLTQQYARLGNMVNTYLREIDEKDISSEVLTLLIEKKLIDQDNLADLKSNKKDLLREVLKECHEYSKQLLSQIEKLSQNIKSFDTKKMVQEIKDINELFAQRAPYWLPEYKNKFFIKV